MENRRRFSRCLTQMEVKYFLKKGEKSWKECTIFNISRNGVGMKFQTGEDVSIGSTVHLEIAVPMESVPINVEGMLMWIKKVENDFIGSIELTEVLDDVKWSKLG